jgi:uncharacterized membrane protein
VQGVGPVFDQAWSAYRLRAPLLLGLLAAWGLTWVALEVLVFSSGRAPGTPIWVVLHVLYFWATAYWETAIAGCALDHFAGRPPAPRGYLGRHRLVWHLLVLKIVLIPAILLGMALVLIPGIILTARLGLAFFALVDRRCGPRAALALAWERTRGSTLGLARLILALVAFNVAGAALLGLGLLLTVPMTALAAAHTYHALAEDGSPDATPPVHEAPGVHPHGGTSEPIAP